MPNIEHTPLFEAYFKSFTGNTEQGGKILTLVKCQDGDKEKVRALISDVAPEEGDIFAEFNGGKETENKISDVILSKKIPEDGCYDDVLKGQEHANAKVLFVRSEKLDEGFRWIAIPSYLAEEFDALRESDALEESNLIKDDTASNSTVSDMIFEGLIEEATNTIYDRICRAVIDGLNEQTEENSILTQLTEAVAALGRIDEEEVEAIQEAKALVETLEIKSLGLNEEAENPELAAVTEIIGAARALGGTFDSVGYSEGLLMVDLHNKAAVSQFSDWLEDNDAVFAYDIEVDTLNQNTGIQEPQVVDLDAIKNDQNCTFGFSIYLDPSLVEYDGYEVDVDEDEELGPLDEVVRKIKINFKGKKRIKMKCQRGFKWDSSKRACVKIGGSEIAKMRKRLRRAVLTKRAKGVAFKTRVLRKTRKAKRFRRMMGLN